MEREENVLPMIPAGASYRDMILDIDTLPVRIDAAENSDGAPS